MESPPILFEDASLLVLDKPSGLAAHPGRGVPQGESALDWARTRLSPSSPALPHRLDRETSGILVVAKTALALRALNRAWKMKHVSKTYVALVKGNQPASGSIGLPLEDAPSGRRTRAAKGKGGTPARTDYRTLEYFRDLRPSTLDLRPSIASLPMTSLSLVEALPRTGRTHQIRAHFASTGHPVAGDPLYGDPAFNRALAQSCALTRTFLHASRIELPHPATGKPLRLESPLPRALAEALVRLRGAGGARPT